MVLRKGEEENLKQHDLNYWGDTLEHSVKELTTYKTQRHAVLKLIQQSTYPNRTTI